MHNYVLNDFYLSIEGVLPKNNKKGMRLNCIRGSALLLIVASLLHILGKKGFDT